MSPEADRSNMISEITKWARNAHLKDYIAWHSNATIGIVRCKLDICSTFDCSITGKLQSPGRAANTINVVVYFAG